MHSSRPNHLGFFEGERKRIERQLERDDSAPWWVSIPVTVIVYGALSYALLAAFLPELPQ